MLRRIVLACALLAILAAAPAARAQAPEDVRVERELVPLPANVVATGACVWRRDATGLLCHADLRDTPGRQVVTVRPDGSGFRCLTCAAGVPDGRRPHKLAVFPDGRRFVVGTLPAAEANADEGASLQASVGECAPSLAECDSLTFTPLEMPTGTGSLNDREIRLSPDGRRFVYTIVRSDGFVMLMGDLVQEGGRYVVRDPRVLNPAPNPTTAEDFARRGAFAEAKSFDGGRTLLFGSTEQAGSNLDVYRLDLASGATERVTTNGEWDEDAEMDPRGRYLSVGSARRNFNTLRGATVVPLPPFLDQVKTVFFARFKLANLEERRRALEAWLTDDATEDAGGLGLQLSDLRGGWDARMPIVWSPDGTRLTFSEQGPGAATRQVVVRLADRTAAEPHCAHPEREPACVTPTPEWAPLLRDYPPAVAGSRALPGPGGGVALLTFGGFVAGGEMRVDYRDYTTADGLVFNGSETINGVALRDLRIDLAGEVRVTGREEGIVRASVFGVGRRACGTIEGRLGARRERTVYGWTDPECGFGTPPVCANRRDDDADGLEDLTDPGCRTEEDGDEAGAAGASRRGRTCASRRRIAVTVPVRRGERIRTARVRIGRAAAGRARVLRGRRVVVDLRGRRAGRVRVVVVARTSRGRTVRVARAYATCRRR